MLLTDVSVFVHAHRPDAADHERFRHWLQRRLEDIEPFGVSELVLSAVVRIVTNRRIFRNPTPVDVALEFCSEVLGAPATVPLRPGARHWEIFDTLCRAARARANIVPDAYLAALAIEHGATWVTLDSGFRRFAGLRVQHPF